MINIFRHIWLVMLAGVISVSCVQKVAIAQKAKESDTARSKPNPTESPEQANLNNELIGKDSR